MCPKVNQNNANFVAWLNADDLTNGYFINGISNTAPNAALLSLSNRMSGYLKKGTNMYFDSGKIVSDGNGGIILSNTGAYGAPTAGASITAAVNNTNRILMLGPNQDGNGSGGFDMEFHSARDVNFYAYGYDNDGRSFYFGGPHGVRIETPDASQKVLDVSPGEVHIDAPGTGGGTVEIEPYAGNSNDGYVGIWNPSPSHVLDVGGTFAADSEAVFTDGSGNLTCVSLTQTSDQTLKTNVVPVSNVLPRLLVIPVYSWKFLDRILLKTNFTAQVTWGTNIITQTNGLTFRTNATWFLATSNLLANVKTNVMPGHAHIGPMAQDWSANFGGPTNAINVTDMQGALLAGIQALADPARAQTVAGTVYPSNTWNLAAITNAMPNYSFWVGNSNGQALVSVYLANGVAWVKRIAP